MELLKRLYHSISQIVDYDAPFCEQQYTHGSCYISLFNPIQAGVFRNHIGWGAHCACVSPLFVVQLQPNLA